LNTTTNPDLNHPVYLPQSKMSFSTSLLDGWDLLNKRTVGVLKSCDDFAGLLKEIAKVERDYGKSLVKLSQSSRKDLSKTEPMRKESATTFSCWDTLLAELEKVGDHHSQIADKIENELVKDILNFTKEKSKKKKILDLEGEKIRKDYKTAIENLKKARDKYVVLSKEHDKAEAEHTKGKGDMQMKPAALAKLAAKASQALEKAQASDTEYQTTLQATNQKQTEYYTNLQPNLLKDYQLWEEDRIAFMKGIVEKFAAFHGEHPSFYTTSSAAITGACQAISVDQDIQSFLKENSTGVTAPADIQYQSYEVENTASPGAPPKAPKPTAKPAPKKTGKYQPVGGDSFISSKEWGLTAADNNLSPEDKHTKLVAQMEELDKELVKEQKAKDGLENLVRFYASDPVAQKKAEDQVKESDNKIHQINDLKNLVQGQMDRLAGGGGGGATIRARGLYDYTASADTELSFKAGDILVVTEQDDSGWWYCELNGRQGFVPNNYVELI
jgi:hypothetical protein